MDLHVFPTLVFLSEEFHEEPDGLQSMGSQIIGHDWVTNTHRHTQNYDLEVIKKKVKKKKHHYVTLLFWDTDIYFSCTDIYAYHLDDCLNHQVIFMSMDFSDFH